MGSSFFLGSTLGIAFFSIIFAKQIIIRQRKLLKVNYKNYQHLDGRTDTKMKKIMFRSFLLQTVVVLCRFVSAKEIQLQEDKKYTWAIGKD